MYFYQKYYSFLETPTFPQIMSLQHKYFLIFEVLDISKSIILLFFRCINFYFLQNNLELFLNIFHNPEAFHTNNKFYINKTLCHCITLTDY